MNFVGLKIKFNTKKYLRINIHGSKNINIKIKKKFKKIFSLIRLILSTYI